MPGTRLFFAGCFVVGALLFFGVAGGVFTSRAVTDAQAAGLVVWRANGCEGCHTLYGAGGAYAPDLTHIYSLRGENYLREFLVNPNAFHPEQRLMPRIGLTKTETDNLLAFLSWVSAQSASWPPKPIQVSGGGSVGSGAVAAGREAFDSNDPVARGKALFSRAPANCASCHLLEPDAVRIGPSLAGIATRAGSRVDGQSAETYLRNAIVLPSEYIVEGFPDAMAKNLGDVLTSQQVNDLVAYLMTLK